jgi:1-acyl-sn-glycerol-3-phosphate acyltransferase
MDKPIQFRGSLLAQAFLRLIGWRYVFNGLPSPQGVVIGYPHTSNWDFVVMMPVKWAIGIPLQFFAKDSLFRIPVFGRWLRWIGGMPIDRSSPKGMVGEQVGVLKQHKQEGRYLWLALSPEGTRKHTSGWRSGFYKTAVHADVPVCLVKLDFALRRIDATHFLHLSGDADRDFSRISEFFSSVKGCIPENATPVVLLADRTNSRSNTSI